MKRRVNVTRGETSSSLLAEVDGDTVRFPASALPYRPHPTMGLSVDERPVSAVEVSHIYDPPGHPIMISLTLAPTN